MFKTISKMEKQRQTAGETATTKPAWGIVSIIGLMVAFAAIETSVIIALLGAALLATGAYMGGYMEPLRGDARLTDAGRKTGAQAGERRAA